MKKSILLFAATLFAAATFAQTPTVSASSVTFKYCETTDTAFTVYSLLPYTWHAQDLAIELNAYETTVHTLVNARGCDSIVSFTLKNPALPGKFTVDNKGTQVQFSMGNLQYRATKDGVSEDLMHNVRGGQTRQGEWRFAENQWDVISEELNNSRNQESNYWIDLLHYGSSGYTQEGSGDYYYAYPYKDTWSCYRSITNTEYEWGYFNEISNGGPANCGWFTMDYDQWSWLIQNSYNNDKLSRGTVNGVKGIIILPDNWEIPANCIWTGKVYDSYTTNSYKNNDTTNDWKKMEDAGAVFFPFINVNEYYSGYWTSFGNSSPYIWAPMYGGSTSNYITNFQTQSNDRRYVRLVYKVQ